MHWYSIDDEEAHLQMITGGIRSAVQKFQDAQDEHYRSKALSEIRAAIIAQRQGLVNLVQSDPSAVSSVMREIMQHNVQSPQDTVVTTHEVMLVSYSPLAAGMRAGGTVLSVGLPCLLQELACIAASARHNWLICCVLCLYVFYCNMRQSDASSARAQ